MRTQTFSSVASLALGLAVAATLGLLAGCGGDDVASPIPPDGGADGTTDGPQAEGGPDGGAVRGIEARFTLPATGLPNFLDVPFPTDLYLDATGHIADVPNLKSYIPSNATFLVAGLTVLNGFGTSAGAIFAIDDLTEDAASPKPAAIDVGTLPASEAASTGPNATAMIVDLDATGPSTALVPARADYRDDTSVGAMVPPRLVVWPARGILLAEKHHYAVVLTTGVATTDKKPIVPSATFQAIRDGQQRSSAAGMLYGNAVDKVASLVPQLADKTKIAVMAVYSTHDTVHELSDLRGQFLKMGPPTLDWTPADILPMGPGLFAPSPLPAGYTATLDAWLATPAKLGDSTDDPADDQAAGKAHDAIAAVGTAVFQAPNVLIEAAKGYDDPTHHTFARDATGKPIINPAKQTSTIWMTIVLPKGAMPASGFPTVIVQHGLSGDRSFVLAIADTFAKKGWASVAIEGVTFGARASEPANVTDAKAVFPWSTTGGNYSGPDGFVDSPNGSGDFFGNLKSLGALRDQMRQSVLDIMTASDVIRNPALTLGPLLNAVPGAKLDPGKVAYVGDSLGAIMGAMVAGTDPNLTTFVLNVAGGDISELAAYSPQLASSVDLAGGYNFGLISVRFAPGHPFMQLLQHIVDSGDPLLFAPALVNQPLSINGTVNPPKNVIQIEALFDDYVPNEANEALARAAGLPMAVPNVGSNTGLTFAQATAGANGIQGVPIAAVTAVLVQAGPATHGNDLFDANGQHVYQPPFGQFDTMNPFPKLAMPVPVKEPYLPLQTMMTGFFSSAFAGGGAPVVAGFPTPNKN
jgi:hypothetical protein